MLCLFFQLLYDRVSRVQNSVADLLYLQQEEVNMAYRITILCENSVGPISGTLGEHGFAALIEGEGETLLFDTGQGATLLHNAQRLGKDLCRVAKVALSHGHFDHTGGLRPLLETCGPKVVYGHPALFARRYRVKDTGESIPIGIPHTEESLRALGASFDLSDLSREIAPAIFFTGEVPRQSSFEHGDSGLFCDEKGCAVDTIPDDQSLVLKTPKGLVLLLGCCHAGIINTIDHARRMCGVEEIYAVIGGTHLGFCSQEQLERTVQELGKYRIKKLAPSHCTGFAAMARLAREFPKELHPAQVGYMLEV